MLENINPQHQLVSQSDFIKAVEQLQTHVRSKRNYIGNQYLLSQDACLEVNWQAQNHRREYFSGCTFKNCDLDEAGFTGGIFAESSFSECNINFANFNNCTFKTCSWRDNREAFQIGTNFSQSVLLECELDKLWLQGGNLCDAKIVNTTFNRCRFRSTQFEGAILDNVVLDHVRFGKLNLEFVHFRNIYCDTVTLPFPSIPYIFGGIEYLLNTKDHVRVTSANSSNNKISKEEYLCLLPTLKTYFSGTHSFFPLSNILLAQGETDKAKNAVLAGISQSLFLRNYSLLVHLCELISEYSMLSSHECIELYTDIWLSAKYQRIAKNDYYLLDNAMQKIQQTLLSFNQNKICFLLETNIKSANENMLSILISEIEEFSILVDCNAKNGIELRHCSPYEIFVTIWTGIEELAPYIGLFYCAFMGIDKLYNKILDNISKTQSVIKTEMERKKNALEIESIELENEAKKVDIEIKKQELQNMRQTALKTYKHITDAGIIICSASHNITENSANFVSNEFRTNYISQGK